ncbi:hypothetical protein L208DRAFT_1388363, partial [Tricholoma matsutake]
MQNVGGGHDAAAVVPGAIVVIVVPSLLSRFITQSSLCLCWCRCPPRCPAPLSLSLPCRCCFASSHLCPRCSPCPHRKQLWWRLGVVVL